MFAHLRRHVVHLVALTLAVVAGSARGEWIYLVSKSAGTLVRFSSLDAVNLADPAAVTPVTTLVTGLQQPSGMAVGSDGMLYIAEWGDGTVAGPPRVSRYDIAANQWSPVVSLNATTQAQPSAIAFRPAGLGGEMLVGRVGILDASGQGGIVKISGWATGSPTVSSTPYNTGITLNGSSGLAVAADGTTYVSNSQYTTFFGNPIFQGNVVKLNSTGAYQGEVVANGVMSDGLTGPAGLVLTGSTLYTGSVTNSKVYSTNLNTAATAQFGSLGSNIYFEVGPIMQRADGAILAGSVTGSAVISMFGSDGTLSPNGYFNAGFGTIGGIVSAAVPEPSVPGLVVAGGLIAWAVRRGWRGRMA